MADKPEEKARRLIDEGLTAADWIVQDRNELDLTAGKGIAVREFPMKSGFGFADCLLYIDRKRRGKESGSGIARLDEDPDNTILNTLINLVWSQHKANQPPMSPEEFSFRTKTSYDHLNHIENRRATPSPAVLDHKSEALGFRRLSEFLLLDGQEVL